jgi:uncharacterized protein (TIGR02996 family)
MSTGATLRGLLAAARDDPEDDGPRLVLADWLEEHGDPRGEFVRLQVRLQRLVAYDPTRPDLKCREAELLDRHRDDWLGPLRGMDYDPRFDGGLLFLFIGASALAGLPVEVLASEAFAWVAGVGLCLEEETLTAVAEAFRAPALTGVSELSLLGEEVDDDQLGLLAASPRLGALRRLELGDNVFGAASLRALAWSERVPRLRALLLPRNDLRVEGVRALVSGLLLGRLEELSLEECYLGDDGIAALAQFRAPTRLRELNLARNIIGAAGAAALVRSELLTGCRRLDLSHNVLGDEGAQILLDSPRLSHHLALWVGENGIGDEMLRRLEARFARVYA